MNASFVAVARILRAHGVRGEVRVEMLSEFSDRMKSLDTVWLLPIQGSEPREARVEYVRGDIVKLDIFHERDAARAGQNQLIAIPRSDASPLPPGRYYEHEIVGLKVRDRRRGVIGTVTEIIRTGASDVYVVQGDGRETLVPALRSVVRLIDPDAGVMEIDMPDEVTDS